MLINQLASDVVYLEDGLVGCTVTVSIEFFNDNYSWSQHCSSKQFSSKDGYRFFMEKEVYDKEYCCKMIVWLDDVKIMKSYLMKLILQLSGWNKMRLKFVFSGTSYHAGLTSSYLLKRLSKVKQYWRASEFRHKRTPFIKRYFIW